MSPHLFVFAVINDVSDQIVLLSVKDLSVNALFSRLQRHPVAIHFTASYKLYKKKPFLHKIGSYSSWSNGLHKQLSHFEILCLLCYLSLLHPVSRPHLGPIVPQEAGGEGRGVRAAAPHPAAPARSTCQMSGLKFHLLQVETFISHPQWVQGQVVAVPLPSWVMLSTPLHIFFPFLCWKDLHLTHPSLAGRCSKLKTNHWRSSSMS